MTETSVPLTTRKDWTSDQEVRWCPGCGDYAILSAVQQVFPELNLGQLCRLVRAEYLVDAKAVTKVQGLPFTAVELEAAIASALSAEHTDTDALAQEVPS